MPLPEQPPGPDPENSPASRNFEITRRLSVTANRARAMYRSILTFAFLVSATAVASAESGLASYYPGHGARGEMTCAHRTRPMGSMVTVSHEGHSIRCRVNDRGPFVRGRVIDVSISAARALGMIGPGIINVSLE